MQLKWYKILYFHLMCVDLALSQITPTVKVTILNITATPKKLYKLNRLKCEVQGDPTPDVWWTKADGSYIHGREILFENKNRTLIICGAEPKHVGTYYCNAGNNLSYVNASFELRLIDVPRIRHIYYNKEYRYINLRCESAETPVQLVMGQEYFRIVCRSSGYPNVRVTWKKNGVEIVDYASLSTRVYQRRRSSTRSGNSELYFKKVYHHDAGNYSCESSIDGYEYVDTCFFELIAASSEAFKVSHNNFTTLVQQFTGTVDGVVTPTQLSVFVTPSFSFHGESNATNSAKSTSTLARDGITPTHTDIPLITISVSASKYTLEGTKIQFTCNTALQSFHQIEGMELVKDGIPFYQPIVRHSGLYSTPLFIAKKKDTGKYQCKGIFGAASRYSLPFFLIIGIPSGPVIFEKEPETSSTGIRIYWKPISKMFWNGEEITFQVHVFSVDRDYTLVKSNTTKKNTAIISGLFPSTKYIVNVTGSTAFGPIENRTVKVETNEDVYECRYQDLNSCHEYAHCKDVMGTYICICFEGFFGDGRECRGPAQITAKSPPHIIKYVETDVSLVCSVIADPNPTIVWKHIDVDGKVTKIKRPSDKFDGNITIYNASLQDSGTYLCNASNALGYDFYSTEIQIKPVIVNITVEIKLANKTFNENESSPVYQLLKEDVYLELYNFFNNTPGFKDIEILGFVNGGVKVLFKVIVEVLKPSKETNDVIAVKVGRKIYKQLKTGRIGNIAVVRDALKLNAEPPPAANVSYSDVKETKVHIFWDPPELHELFFIKRYYISYFKHGDTKWFNESIDVDQLTNFELENLKSDSFYTIKIIAENECCLGQESKKMEIKTLKVKGASLWYYIGPIFAIAGIIILVLLICLVRRVSVRSRPYPTTEIRKRKFEERKEITKSTSFTVVDSPPGLTWKELPPKSIEIFKDTLIPGEVGAVVVRGAFSCNSGEKSETCAIKILKENATTEDRRDLINELTSIS